MNVIARKELRDALRNRWVLGYAALLGILGLVAAWLGSESSAGLRLQAYGRTTATLTNLCLMLAPLVALSTAAATIAGERDRGTLEHLLAQPLDRRELLLGKYLGLLASLSLATLAGFLPAGVLVAMQAGGGALAWYLLFPALAVVLVAAMLALGLLVSVCSRGGAQAQGRAVLLWFVFVLLYDLVLLGTVVASGLSGGALAALLVVNPVDATRVLAVLALEPDLYLLGPAGAYLVETFAGAGTAAVLLSALLIWIAVPLAVAVRVFQLRVPSRFARGRFARIRAVGVRVVRGRIVRGRVARSRVARDADGNVGGEGHLTPWYRRRALRQFLRRFRQRSASSLDTIKESSTP